MAELSSRLLYHQDHRLKEYKKGINTAITTIAEVLYMHHDLADFLHHILEYLGNCQLQDLWGNVPLGWDVWKLCWHGTSMSS